MDAASRLAEIKSLERAEFARLDAYLRQLEADGWIEQSYCTDWLVYQVVSHISSGTHIGKARLDNWINGGPAMAREDMQRVWAHFDSLRPEQMLSEFHKAMGEYLAATHSAPDEAGGQEVEGFAGKRPLAAYQLGRLHELVAHSWDVYVARDRQARLAPEVVGFLAPNLADIFVFADPERRAALPFKRVQIRLHEPNAAYVLDLSAERPRLTPGEDATAPLALAGPAEEMCRLVTGRHFVPGAKPALEVTRGTAQDLATLKRAFR